MTGSWPICLTLIAGGLLSLPPSAIRPPSSRREGAALPEPADGPGVPLRWRRALMVGAGVCAVSILLGVGAWWVGVAAAVGSAVVTLRVPERRSNADRAADRRRLAVRADLLAACLDAGMSVGTALLAVRPPDRRPDATSGSRASARRADRGRDDPLAVLDAVAALLLLGADADSAWRSAQVHPDLASLAAAARRSAAAGAGFADAVREHAINLRAATAAAAQRSAGRAGVAMTAPLGLCFLPAFLCLGLAPVVVGLLSTLHLF